MCTAHVHIHGIAYYKNTLSRLSHLLLTIQPNQKAKTARSSNSSGGHYAAAAAAATATDQQPCI
jgi:hypothetical protein